jgi:hypothetical protein
LRGLDIEGRIILKFILGKYRMRIRIGLNWLIIKSKCGQVLTLQWVPKAGAKFFTKWKFFKEPSAPLT